MGKKFHSLFYAVCKDPVSSLFHLLVFPEDTDILPSGFFAGLFYILCNLGGIRMGSVYHHIRIFFLK